MALTVDINDKTYRATQDAVVLDGALKNKSDTSNVFAGKLKERLQEIAKLESEDPKIKDAITKDYPAVQSLVNVQDGRDSQAAKPAMDKKAGQDEAGWLEIQMNNRQNPYVGEMRKVIDDLALKESADKSLTDWVTQNHPKVQHQVDAISDSSGG